MKKLLIRPLLFVTKLVGLLLVLSLLWVIVYRFVNPPISGMMMYKSFTEENYYYQQRWVELQEVAPSMPLALIAAEDQLFLKHKGFDLKAIKRAIQHNSTSVKIRGGSTISQQVAKNVFLVPSRTIFRKVIEAYFTALIELIWGKERIMEVYLNVVELGEGLYGVEKAAVEIFDKKASELSKEEAALIATVLPNPITFKLEAPTPYMMKRKGWILKQMHNLGGERLLKEWYE